MYTIGPRALVRITVGLTAIGRKIAGAISGWLDSGRDVRINTIRLAEIGTVIVATRVDGIGIGIVTTRVGAMRIEIVDFDSDGKRSQVGISEKLPRPAEAAAKDTKVARLQPVLFF